MAMRLVEPPGNAFETIRDGLRRLRARPHPRLLVERPKPEALEVLAPHPVYELGLDAAAAGGGADRLRLSSFRWLVGGGEGPLAAAEIGIAPGGAAGALRHVSEGAFVGATERAIRVAEALEDVARGDFELRLIRSTGLRFLALWLAEKDSSRDLAIPLAPAPPWLAAEEPIPLATLFAKARDAAVAESKRPADPFRPG